MIIFAYLITFVIYTLLSMTLTIGSSNFRKDFLNPLYVFLLYFSITFFGLPIFQIKDNSFRYSMGYSDNAYLWALLYLNVFVILVLVTFLVLIHKIYVRKTNEIFDVQNWQDTNKLSRVFLRIVVLIPSMLVISYFYKFIVDLGYNDYLSNRIILLSGKGYYTIILMSLIPFLLFEIVNSYYIRNKHAKRTSKVFFWCLILLATTPGIVLGSRTNLLLPFLLINLSFTHLKNRGSLITVNKIFSFTIPIIILLYIGFWLEGYRQSIMAGIEITSSGLILQIAGGFGTAENIFWWFDNADGEVLYGTSLLAVLVGLIPRSLWPDKPFGGGPAFTNTMYPGKYDQAQTNISSLTTGFPFEFLMNFGFVGAVISGMIFGTMLAIIYFYRTKIRNSMQYVIWIMLMYCTISYLHGEVFGVTSKLIGLVLPLLISEIIGKLLKKRESYSDNFKTHN